MYIGFRFLVIIFLFVFTACSSSYQSTKLVYTNYKIDKSSASDSSMTTLLKPYRDLVDSNMSMVVGFVDKPLEKAMPESSLGNIMADAFLYEAIKKFHLHVDIAFMNYGGIRLTQIPAGPLKMEKIYEIMPFENLVVLQKLTGELLQQLLDHVSSRGGWPAAGLTYKIKNKKAIDIIVQGKPLNKEALYTVANSDYIANGGDNCEMLKIIPQQNIGFLMRDALIDYFSAFRLRGENISIESNQRVVNVE